MTIFAAPGANFLGTLEDAPTGLVGTLQLGIFLHPAGTVVSAYATTGITENAGGATSDYDGVRTAPTAAAAAGTDYFLQWKNGSTITRERLVVGGAAPQVVAGTPFDLLKLMTAAAQEPLLSDDELNKLLGQNKTADTNGLYASDVGWVPTYDLNAAAAEGWLWKAGKCSPNYGFGEDAQQFDRQQVFDHCMQMHEHYTKGSSGSAKVPSMIDDFDPATGYGGPLVTGFFDVPFT